MGMFKKLGIGKSAEQKSKEAEEAKEWEESKQMEEEEQQRREYMPLEREEDECTAMAAAEAWQRELALRIQDHIARMALATPELTPPLPPSFRALEELNEFSVIKTQACIRRMLAIKTVGLIRAGLAAEQAARDGAARECALDATVASMAALAMCEKVVGAALDYNSLLARLSREAAATAMAAAWVSMRNEKLALQSHAVAPYNVEWIWGPTKGSNIWTVSMSTPDTARAIDTNTSAVSTPTTVSSNDNNKNNKNSSSSSGRSPGASALLHPADIPFDVPPGKAIQENGRVRDIFNSPKHL